MVKVETSGNIKVQPTRFRRCDLSFSGKIGRISTSVWCGLQKGNETDAKSEYGRTTFAAGDADLGDLRYSRVCGDVKMPNLERLESRPEVITLALSDVSGNVKLANEHSRRDSPWLALFD